ncbi:MAG: response regulator transcription factor [Acidobacteriaceae bacterium]|nr:response regulator transcription factor [Acidobacteriaceae bacterium]
MNETAGRVLVVDDESTIRQALGTTLNALGFRTETAANGDDALAAVRRDRFEAVLLDINMPGISGIDTCREMRRVAPWLPILMLTVRDSENDIVNALDAGADDYITKPFHIKELTARLRASVRRVRAMPREAPAVLSIGEIELDPDRRSVKKSGEAVRLTPKEFELLHYLMAHAGICITHSRLLRAVWGPEYGNELEYLRTFVRQLRKKIEEDPAKPIYLLTDPYVGYRFCEPSQVARAKPS